MSTDTRIIQRLIFVFNATAGPRAAWVDSVKKVLMIQGCSLCAITHGLFGEKSKWRSCKEELNVPVDYYHRDDLPPKLHAVVGNHFPCVVAEASGEFVVILDAETIARCKGSVEDLRGRLQYRSAIKGLRFPQPSNL